MIGVRRRDIKFGEGSVLTRKLWIACNDFKAVGSSSWDRPDVARVTFMNGLWSEGKSIREEVGESARLSKVEIVKAAARLYVVGIVDSVEDRMESSCDVMIR